MINTLSNKQPATKMQAFQVFNLLTSIHPLSNDVLCYLENNLYTLTVKKGEILDEAGNVCEMIYFIRRGVIRAYVKEDKRDVTTWISVENELAASIASFVVQTPSVDNLQAIEDAELIGISFTSLQQLYELIPAFNIAARRMYEKYYVDAEIRALIARQSKAEKKYEFFLQSYGHLSNRIPLTYIASFLGINLATLSRIRSQRRRMK